MKVLMLNGSIHEDGNTMVALEEIGKQLEKQGIEYEIFQIGTNPIRPALNAKKTAVILQMMSATRLLKKQKKQTDISLHLLSITLILAAEYYLFLTALFIPAARFFPISPVQVLLLQDAAELPQPLMS